ncbi:MAG TPA: hypothetical protein VF533_17170 [Solirubrobacteraceae bacterium]
MLRALAALLLVLAVTAVPAPAWADVVDDHPAIVARSPGDLVLFARGADGAVYVREGLDGAPWVSIGGEATSGPAAMVRPDGTLDVFVRGPGDAAWHASRARGGTWTPWESLGGVLISGPGATARLGTDTIDLFGVGTGSNLHHKAWNPRDGWSAWGNLGGGIGAAPSPVSRKTGWLDTYVRGTDSTIYNKSYTNGAWTDFDDVAGKTLSAPSAITRGNANLDVFVRGTDRGLHQKYFIEGSGYSDWFQVDPKPLDSGPAAVADGPNRVHVLARGGGDVLVKSWESGKGWAAWRSLGPVTPPAPPPPPPAPPSPPAPVGGGTVRLGTGLACTPRGGRLRVTVAVRRRKGRAKPRVQKVVFFYKKGRGAVARADRQAPFGRRLPIDLKAGKHRVYARIYYKRPGKRKIAKKTVSRRFAVCA